MAAILANLYPDLYAGAGIHSGLAAGAATDLPTALAAMKNARPGAAMRAGNGVRTIVFHGDRDSTVHPANAQSVVTASAGSAALVETAQVPGKDNGRSSTIYTYRNAAGKVVAERWEIHGGPHAWAGGSLGGSYTDPAGPDATAEMLRFFFERT
jgi:poly(3-hydroxybutyrate) depolymerase